MMGANAQVEITASDRSLAGQLARAASRFSSWAGTVARDVGGAMSKINSKMKLGETGSHAVGNLISGGIGKGIGMFTEAAGGVRTFERDLVRLQITANQSPAWSARMRDAINGVSRDTGVAREEILGGTQAYIDLTGDVGGATAAMRSFGRISLASGANINDIATAAATMNQVMGVTGDQFEGVFSGLIAQGKEGAVSLKDMAASLSSMLPKMRQFAGGDGAQGVLDLGAAFQTIRQTTGEASEAATNFEALTSSIVKNARNLKYVGIEVFSDKAHTKLRSFHDIIKDIRENKKMKSLDMAQAVLGGRKEAREALEVLERQWDTYEKLVETGKDRQSVERDSNAMLESEAGKLDKAMNSIKLTVAAAFTPERITAFADAMESIASKVGTVVDGVGKLAGVLGKIEGMGEFIAEKVFGQDGKMHLDGIDKVLLGGGTMMEKAAAASRINQWQDEGTLDKHRRTAEINKAYADNHNNAVDKIMAAQGDSKSVTSDAYWAAIQASWATKATHGEGFMGAAGAGQSFLSKTHSHDYVREAVEIMAKATTKMDSDKAIARAVAKGLADGFGLLLADGGLSLKIGDNQVAKSGAQAKSGRTAPAKH